MVRRRVWAGGVAAVLALVMTGPAEASSPVARSVPTGGRSAAAGTLPPEFTGTLTVTFDVTALESDSDMTPGNYDQSHLTGTVSLRPQQGSTSVMFDNYLYSDTVSLAATSTVTRYAPQGPCQNHTFEYAPASNYPGFPAYFGLQTPELAVMNGHRWGLYLGSVVGAQTIGCAGQDGNWPIENFQEYVAKFLADIAIPDQDASGGLTHLAGTTSLGLSFPPVVDSNDIACADDGVYFDPCITAWNVALTYDLQRIPANRPASQYPTLTLVNNAKGDDVIVVRTDTAVPHTRVVVERIVPGKLGLASQGANPLVTNAKGVLRLVLKDSNKSGRRWFLAYVDGTVHVLPGMTRTKSIK
jgi:hypothetical protein